MSFLFGLILGYLVGLILPPTKIDDALRAIRDEFTD